MFNDGYEYGAPVNVDPRPPVLYQVTMREEEDRDVHINGTQWEFNNWIDEDTALYDVAVDAWAIVPFEQEMNSRPDVISYTKIG